MKKSISLLLAVCLLAACLPMGASAATAEKEKNDTFQTAQTISVNSAVTGNIAKPDDRDYFKFTLSAPGYVSFSFAHDYIDTTSNIWSIRLHLGDTQNYEELVEYYVPGNYKLTETSPVGLPAGTYYVRLAPYSSYNHHDNSYSFTVNYTKSSSWETESNDSFQTADSISVNATTNGNSFSSSDRDYYKFALASPGLIFLSFAHDYIDTTSNIWTIRLYLGDTQNYEKLVEYYISGNYKLTETGPIGLPSGTYYAEILPYSSYNHYDIPYSFTVRYTKSDSWETEQNDSFQTADPISLNKPYSGSIFDHRDDDYYAFSLNSDASVYFLFSHDYIDSTSNYWSVSIHADDNENSKLTSFNIAGKEKAYVSKPLSLSKGKYYVKLTGYSFYNSSSMKYSFALSTTGGSISYSPLYGISLDQSSLSLVAGATASLTATTSPLSAVEKTVIWSSSDNSVASVSSSGVVTAKSAGSAVITVTTPDGCVSASCNVSVTASSSSNQFTDVEPGAFYEDAVKWAVENGITKGTSKDKFSPMQTCNRGQAVTFLWRAAGSPEPSSSVNPFTDVKPEDFFYKAVLWAVEKGITKGTSKDKFSPNKDCDRGTIVTFQYRAAGSPAVSAGSSFTDVSAGQYYTDAVAWAVQKGITKGTSATKFSPVQECNRGQIVTFLYRGK